MKQIPEFPVLRSDLEIIAQPLPGKPDRYVIKDPKSDNIVELSEKEIFICRQLDGHTSLSVISSRFQDQYNLHISIEKLEVFIRQLDEQAFLVSSVPQITSIPQGWEAMKPLPFYFDQLFEKLSRVFSWAFRWWFYAFFFVFLMIAFTIVGKCWHFLIYEVQKYVTLIIQGSPPPFSFQNVFLFVLILVVIPLIREVCKAITCRHYGGRVPEIRYMWYMHFIPRFYSDISTVSGMKEKKHRLHTVASGPLCELLLVVIGIIGWKSTGIDNPLKSLWSTFTLASTISIFLNLNPLGKGDGILLLSIWLGIKDFRNRAVKVAQSWLLRQPIPEPLTFKEGHLFKWYGIFAGGYYITLTIFVLGFAGYLLTYWLKGVGFILFLVLVVLRFEDEIRRIITTIPFFRWLRPHCFKNGKVRGWLICLGLVLVYFAPCHYEIGGEFQIQPGLRRGIRAKVEGQIESVLIEEGEWVKAGDIIVQLSKRNIQKDFTVAKASLDEVVARLEAAKLRLNYSRQEAERAKQLYEKEQISTQDYEDRQREWDLDKQEYHAQKAEVQRLQALVAHYEENLALTEIRSPIDGRITTPYLKEKLHQLLGVGDLLAMVEDIRTVLVEIDMPEQYIGEVKVGVRVRAKTWAYSGRVFTGKVIVIAPVAADKQEVELQRATVTQEKGAVRILDTQEEKIVRVFAELPNPDGLLKSGMTGYAKVQAGWKPLGALLISGLTRFFRVEVWSWLP